MKSNATAVSVGLILIGAMLAGTVPPAMQAQTDMPSETPLHALLALVPASAAEPDLTDSRWSLWINYVDYRATEAARVGVPTFATWAEYEADIDTAAGALWRANWLRVVFGNAALTNPRNFDGGLTAFYGFDYFDIDQSLIFSLPEAQGILYGGDFDLATIEATFTARTYEPHRVNGAQLWCGPVGCENGYEGLNWLPDQERDPMTPGRRGDYPILGGSCHLRWCRAQLRLHGPAGTRCRQSQRPLVATLSQCWLCPSTARSLIPLPGGMNN